LNVGTLEFRTARRARVPGNLSHEWGNCHIYTPSAELVVAEIHKTSLFHSETFVINFVDYVMLT